MFFIYIYVICISLPVRFASSQTLSVAELLGTRSLGTLEDAVSQPFTPCWDPPCLALRASAGANPSKTDSELGLTYHLGERA